MSMNKTLAIAGLLAASVVTAYAAPKVKLLPSGAKAGGVAGVVIYAQIDDPNDAMQQPTAGAIQINFDPALVTGPTSKASAVAAEGWTVNDLNANGVGKVTIVVSNTSVDGYQKASGPIVTIPFTKVGSGSGTVAIDASSSFTNMAYDVFPVDTNPVPVLPGAVRKIGGAISGAPSVGFANVAVVADNALRLLKKDDLSDVATATLSAAIAGRPSFGSIAGQAVVAVGTVDGKVSVFDAGTGAAVGSATSVGTAASSPAITADGTIYVGAVDGTAALKKIVGGNVSAVSLAGTALVGDPAVYAGYAIQATDAGVQTVRVPDMVPQATITDTAMKTSAVVLGNGKGVIASASKIYDVDLTTGAISAGVASPTELSEGFPAADGIYFGGKDGSIVKYAAGAPVATPGFSGKAIVAAPLVIGGVVYGLDTEANYKGGSIASAVKLGDAGAKALAATGTSAEDSIIIATADGMIAGLPL